MPGRDHPTQARGGFALVVVLSTLSIIALLFAISSSRILTRAGDLATEQRLAEWTLRRSDLLDLAVAGFGAGDGQVPADGELRVPGGDGELTVRLRDTGGLIDLNTAAPEILDQLAAALGVSADAMAEYRRWRRTPRRLQRVSDFARITGLGPEESRRLQEVATVYSGRRGVAPAHASDVVLQVLTGLEADRATLLRRLPPSWATPSSGSVFEVTLSSRQGPARRLGVVQIAGTGAAGRVLAMD